MRLLALALLAPLLAAAPAPKPHTIAIVPRGVDGLAQDGRWLAWRDTFAYVFVRRLDRGVTRRYAVPGRTDGRPLPFAVAGGRVLWETFESGNDTYEDVNYVAFGDRLGGFLEEAEYSNGYGDGDHLAALAGDGPTLLYSIVTVGVRDCEDFDDPCVQVVGGGGVRRVSSSKRVRVSKLPGVPPTWQLAASGRRMALVPLERGRDLPAPERRVEVRDAVSGALVSSFSAGSKVRALALSPSTAAVLTGGAIEWHDPSTGRLVGSLPVPAATAPELSLSGRRLLFRVGTIVQLLDTRTRTVRVLVQTRADPVGLSIEGDRVVWAEALPGGASAIRVLRVGA